MRALGIGVGDEVIVPANTFIATAEAVTAAGAIPRFVDVDPDTLLITPGIIEAAIGARTAAVIPVHLFGNMPDMVGIEQVCQDRNLTLIEDAAQAHGASHLGRRAGAWGTASSFSFYPGKNLGAFGDGGAITTNDRTLADKVRSLANHGRSAHDRHCHDLIGRNSRLDALQAGILSVKLRHLDRWNASRRAAAAVYQEHLPEPVRMVATTNGTEPVRHVLAVEVNDRNRIALALEEHGVGVGIHYPIPCHVQPAFIQFAGEHLPVCELAADRLLSLPMHPTLSTADVERVCDALREAVHA